jgi:hypothetical protein
MESNNTAGVWWRWWILTFLLSAILGALLALPSAVSGQEITDTVFLTIQGNLTDVTIVRDFIETPAVGDTVIFSAVAVDEEGDPIAADFTWLSGDTTALQLIQQPDGTAIGIALRKATVWVAVRAEPITEVLLASFRDGELNWSGLDSLVLGNDLQLCAYAVRGGFLVAESPGPPTCPIVFTPEPTPPGYWLAEMFDPVRVKPWGAFQRLQGVGL